VDAFGGEDVGLDGFDKGRQRSRTGADPVGKRRDIGTGLAPVVTDITYKNYLLIPLQGGLHRKDTKEAATMPLLLAQTSASRKSSFITQ
jgi:hypothetical protein